MTETLPHQIRCIECGQPMKWRRSRDWWEGDYGYSTYDYECQNACQMKATITYTHYIPVDVARMRPVRD